MMIFNLPGPEFLLLYCVLFCVAGVLAVFLPHLFRGPSDVPMHLGAGLDPFDIALLKGGKREAIRAGLAALHNRGMVIPDGQLRGFTRPVRAHGEVSAFERRVLDQVQNRFTPISDIYAMETPAGMEQRLAEQSLLMGPFRLAMLRIVRCAPLLALAAIGMNKIGVGMSRQRPVGFLFALTLAAVAAAIWGFLVVPRTTWRGKRFLQSLKERHSAHEFSGRRRAAHTTWSEDAMAVALFGIACLPFGSNLSLALQMPERTGSHWFDGSGCSGGGCGGGGCGGGGCGGGGCGGGGCGGCGGS